MNAGAICGVRTITGAQLGCSRQVCLQLGLLPPTGQNSIPDVSASQLHQINASLTRQMGKIEHKALCRFHRPAALESLNFIGVGGAKALPKTPPAAQLDLGQPRSRSVLRHTNLNRLNP